MFDSDRLVFVDVGGLGGLQDCWRPHLDKITPVIFEPNPPEAEALRVSLGSGAMVVECALSDKAETRELHVTRSLGCTSVRVANQSFLSKYSINPAFRVTHTINIDCHRYQDLYLARRVPAPDAIKLDVQGFEYEALVGFGDLLDGCLAIQVEAHIYQVYEGQRLLHDITECLRGHGLSLRKIIPVDHFDGDVVEVDA